MTTAMDAEKLLGQMSRARARETVAHIETLRSLRHAYERGISQTQLAKLIRVTQPSVHNMLRRAAVEAPDVRPGTHGGTAYEIAVRCAAGQIDRETMRRELIDWTYDAPYPDTAYPQVDDVRPQRPGEFGNQVVRAYRDGYLTAEDYDLILDAVADE